MNHQEPPTRVSNSQMGPLTGNITVRPTETDEEARNDQHIRTDHLLANLKRPFLTLASFIVGLLFGPLAVAIAFSATGLLGRLPILYYISGRRGPVSTSDLWTRFFRQLPLWVAVFATTWLIRSAVTHLHPLTQSLICAPIGVLAGVAFICLFEPQRRIAICLLETIRELTNKR